MPTDFERAYSQAAAPWDSDKEDSSVDSDIEKSRNNSNVDLEKSRSNSDVDLESSIPDDQQPESKADYTSSPIPDGGLWAWLQVVSGFMLYLNSWGIVTAYGVFQSFYARAYLQNESSSSIAWIGTIQGFLLAFMSVFAGPVLDRGHPRLLVAVGGFLVVFGLMMTSLGHSYWQLFLAQGVCVGLGSGHLFIVAVAIIPGWFAKKRSFSTGLAAAGSAVGGIIYPIAFFRLEPVIGFGWAVRVIAFIALGCILVSLSICRMRTLPPPRPKIVDFTGFKEVLFTLFSLLSFIGAMGLYVPYFFISDYAAQRVDVDPKLSAYILPIMAAGGIVGRTVPAMLGDKFGCLRVLTFTTSVCAVLCFAWIAIKESEVNLIAWSILYGIFSGPFVSLQTPTIATITPDMRFVGGRMGMCTFCMALGVLLGNPIAGLIEAHGGWIGLQCFAGATLAISAVMTGITMVIQDRQDLAGSWFMWRKQS